MQADILIQELIKHTQNNLKEAQSFKNLSREKLNHKQNSETWSILENLEHLNRYGDFYIPEIEKQLLTYNFDKSSVFKPGLLGDYFAKSMLPKENFKKIKTFKSMNPNNSVLDITVIDKFLNQQEKLISLLELSREADLSKIKTATSISKLVKLRLGDTFRVVIYHNIRHIVQSKKALAGAIF